MNIINLLIFYVRSRSVQYLKVRYTEEEFFIHEREILSNSANVY